MVRNLGLKLVISFGKKLLYKNYNKTQIFWIILNRRSFGHWPNLFFLSSISSDYFFLFK